MKNILKIENETYTKCCKMGTKCDEKMLKYNEDEQKAEKNTVKCNENVTINLTHNLNLNIIQVRREREEGCRFGA